jgi:nickel/cobalt transporter (NiCoT) family protein
LISVIVALGVAGVEAIELLRDQLGLTGGIWELVGSLNEHLGALGFIIIAIFVVSWVGSMLLYRLRGYRQLE